MRKQALFASIALLSLPAMAEDDSQPSAAQSPAAQIDTPPADALPPDAQPSPQPDAAKQAAIAKALAARTCPLPAIANTAPLEQVAGSSLMTVPMAINGYKKEFLLDIAGSLAGIAGRIGPAPGLHSRREHLSGARHTLRRRGDNQCHCP
jgi:hypothetical protein